VVTKRRRYSKVEKVAAIVTAEMTNATAASAATGIPETNIRRWQDDPTLAEYGAKTREELAEVSKAIANLAGHKLLVAIRDDRLEPRDLLMAYGVGVDKSQLLSGGVTERTETRDISMDDHERQILRDAIDEHLKEPSGAS